MGYRVGINGAAGRMGRRLVCITHEDPQLELSAATEYAGHPWLGVDIGSKLGLGDVGVLLADSFGDGAEVDVVVDFTRPEPCLECAEFCAKHKIPFVSGTTGFKDQHKKRIFELAQEIPMVLAPNFSLGVNLLFNVVGTIARALGNDYHVEIVEAHHAEKEDAPSGTAYRIAENIAKAMSLDPNKNVVYGREGMIGARKHQEIGVHAIRMGDVVGEHTVYFATGGERLEISHRAGSRDTFARGALRSAKWLLQEKRAPSAYNVAQVLGLVNTDRPGQDDEGD